MRAPVIALVGAALAGPAGTPAHTEGACAARLTAPWATGGTVLRVEASINGTRCAGAIATLAIRSRGGATLATFASAVADLPPDFAEAASPGAMQAALRAWIAQPPGRTTRTLPSWEDAEVEPREGSTRFHPEPAVTRIRYADLRRWGQPMFCFRQDSESEACYAFNARAGTLTLIGTRLPHR